MLIGTAQIIPRLQFARPLFRNVSAGQHVKSTMADRYFDNNLTIADPDDHEVVREILKAAAVALKVNTLTVEEDCCKLHTGMIVAGAMGEHNIIYL